MSNFNFNISDGVITEVTTCDNCDTPTITIDGKPIDIKKESDFNKLVDELNKMKTVAEDSLFGWFTSPFINRNIDALLNKLTEFRNSLPEEAPVTPVKSASPCDGCEYESYANCSTCPQGSYVDDVYEDDDDDVDYPSSKLEDAEYDRIVNLIDTYYDDACANGYFPFDAESENYSGAIIKDVLLEFAAWLLKR